METYEVFVTDDMEGWFDWPGLKSAMRIRKTTERMRAGEVVKKTLGNQYVFTSSRTNTTRLFEGKTTK